MPPYLGAFYLIYLRMIWFNYNGKLFKEDEPAIAVCSRGLRYGDGIFETMKWLNGKLILADEHFARLWKGLQTLQFDIPVHFTPEKITAAVSALVKKNNHTNGARVRLTIIRGNGGLYDAVNHQPNYIIETWALPEDNGLLNSNGLITGIYDEVKKSCDLLSNVKHNNYLPYVMAALYAKKQKWNDAIILNTKGNICDSSIANIFIIKDSIFFTPHLKEGCVAGVMRGHIIHFLKNAGYTVQETAVTVPDILTADEVFLTNSIYNIRWVQRAENKEYNNQLIQKIYSALLPTIC
jgi:aminodeoxychorismate lyase